VKNSEVSLLLQSGCQDTDDEVGILCMRGCVKLQKTMDFFLSFGTYTT